MSEHLIIPEAARTALSRNKKPKRHIEPPSPEAMASALAEADEKIKKAQRIEESRQRAEAMQERTLARLDREIAEKEAKATQAAKEKLQGIDAELKGKLARNKEKKQKLNEDDYESYVVSGGEDAEKEENAKLDRIFEAYEEAETVGNFAEFMLKHSDMALTQERAESDPTIKKYLESKFDEEKTGLRYEDMVHALPSEEDYKENALGRKLEADAEKEPQRSKFVPSMPELQQFGVIEEKPPIGTAMRDLRKKLKKNADSKKPSKDTEEAMASLKNLPSAEENVEEEIEEIRPEDVVEITDLETPISKEKPSKKKSLVEVAKESAAKEIPFLKPETREALKHSAEEEEVKSVRENQRFAPRPEDKKAAERKNRDAAENNQWREDKLELLSKSLLQAYREKGVKVTKDNEADYLTKAPPFTYIFSAKGRKVRDLYASYVKELK